MALNTGASESMLSYLCSDCELIEGGEFLQEKDLYPFLTVQNLLTRRTGYLRGTCRLELPCIEGKAE